MLSTAYMSDFCKLYVTHKERLFVFDSFCYFAPIGYLWQTSGAK